MKTRLRLVSGGQTGVDRAALDVALACGVDAGGWCPEGRKAEDGVIDARYPLDVLAGAGYPERTLKNILDSDGSIIIYFGKLSGGTKLTHLYCSNEHKPCLLIDACTMTPEQASRKISDFLEEHSIKTLNVAGPRASGEPRAYDYTAQTLSLFFT